MANRKLAITILIGGFVYANFMAFHEAKNETRAIQKEFASYKAQYAPKLAFVNASQIPPRFGPSAPDAVSSRPIEVGVTNISNSVVGGVKVRHLYNLKNDSSEPYPNNELLRPRNVLLGQYQVSINPGETEFFVFGEDIIRKDGTRYIQFPMKDMRLEPGHGPDQGGFPYVYRIGLQVSGENTPVIETVFRLTMFENGYSFLLEKKETQQ